jgi:cytochrome c biogenesis protein CcmG, thiol:disulfide interchange protein DsbE
MVTRRRALGAAAVLALVAALVVVELLSGSSSENARPAPALPRQALVGPRLGLADLRGHPAAINFWASWCEPCRKEAPGLARLARSLPRRTRLVGVDDSDAVGGARGFIGHYRWRFPNLRDGNGRVSDAYRVAGLPTTFILDSKGRIVDVLRGPQDPGTVRRALASAD